MGKLSRTAKAGYLAVGSASGAIVGVLIASILSRCLSMADYATYRQTYFTYTIVAPLLSLGLPAAVYYFLPRRPEKSRGILFQMLFAVVITTGSFAMFIHLGGAELIADRFENPALKDTLKWFAFFPLCFVPTMFIGPVLVTADKAPWVTGFTLYGSAIRILLVVLPIFIFKPDPLYAVIGLVIGSVIMAITAIWLGNRVLPAGNLYLEFGELKKICAYAIPLGIGTVIDTLSLSLDKLLVSSFHKPEVFAVFINGAMEIPFIGIITGAAASVMLPEISKLRQEGKNEESIALFKRSATKCAYLLFPLAGAFFVMAPEIMFVLYGPRFIESADYFRVYLLLIPIRVVIYSVLFQAASRTDLVLKRAILNLIINAILSYVLLKIMGPIGTAVGTVISILIFVVPFCLYSSSKIYQIRVRNILPYATLGRIIGVVVVPVTVAVVWVEKMQDSHWVFLFVTKSILISLFVIPLWFPMLKSWYQRRSFSSVSWWRP